MKKSIAIILTFVLTLSLAACGSFTKVETPENLVDDEKTQQVSGSDVKEEKEDKEDKAEATKNPTETAKPDKTEKPSEAPTKAPEKQPTETPQATTLGRTLLNDFKAKANAGMDIQAIADGLLANPAIQFAGATMPVEEGLLTGFDNAEITGFKSGVMFAPMIGSIAFIGYVFELESSAHASSLIAKLEASANPRWNICVAADEVVTGSAGNKVFFVMCPTSLEG